MACNKANWIRPDETIVDSWNGTVQLIDIVANLDSALINVKTPWGEIDNYVEIDKGSTKTYTKNGKKYVVHCVDVTIHENKPLAKLYMCYEFAEKLNTTTSVIYDKDASQLIEGGKLFFDCKIIDQNDVILEHYDTKIYKNGVYIGYAPGVWKWEYIVKAEDIGKTLSFQGKFDGTTGFNASQSSIVRVEIPKPPVDPPAVGDYIGNITYEITSSISDDEIKFTVPITNKSDVKQCFYIDLRDDVGKFLEKSPTLLPTTLKLEAGESGVITVNSSGAIDPMWGISDVQGQTIKFELKSQKPIIGICVPPPIGYEIIETKQKLVETYIEEPDTGDYIGDITYEIISSIGDDEIKFTVPITNISDKKKRFAIQLYDEKGMRLLPLVADVLELDAGKSDTMTIDSRVGASEPSGEPWGISDVQGQTVKFILKGRNVWGLFASFKVLGTKYKTVETYTEQIPPDICAGHGIILDVKIEPMDPFLGIGEAEVKFHARISNDGSCNKYFRVTLYDEYGTKIDTEPDIFHKYIKSGEIEIITISSAGKLWHAGTIPTTQTPYFVLEERQEFDFGNWEALADRRHCPEWKDFVYVPPGPPIDIPDIGKVAPTMKLPGIVLEGSTFNITGTYEPNETLKLYIDKKLPELDVSIKEFTTDSNGDYDIEFEFDTAGIRKMYVSHCSLCKKSERSTIIVIGYIHIALVIAAMGMIIWKLRRSK